MSKSAVLALTFMIQVIAILSWLALRIWPLMNTIK